ncbi:MAG: PEP-CTERM sorting domain-containing protein [Burkholderiales bacterium]
MQRTLARFALVTRILRPSVAPCGRMLAPLVALVAAFAEMAVAGPTSPLYLSTGTQIQVLQGESVLDSWPTGEQEYSIAVDTTLKTWTQGSPALSLLGREYLLDGTPTGGTYVNTVGCCFRDGTTDGKFNYAIRVAPVNNEIYRFNLDWTDPRLMTFGTVAGGPIEGDSTGIAYDSSDDTFWLAQSNLGSSVSVVLHVSRSGGVISFFGVPRQAHDPSLAYDPADNTLWLYLSGPLGGPSQLLQYSTSDALNGPPRSPLSSQPGSGYVPAMEFQLHQTAPAIPEPSIAALLGAGLAALLCLRTRRRNHAS